jgi:hypothetical protein
MSHAFRKHSPYFARLHPGTGHQSGISAPESPRSGHSRPSATGIRRPFPLHNSCGPTHWLQSTLPRPVGPAVWPCESMNACLPRQSYPSDGARGAGSRKSSGPGPACSRCTRILPVSTGSSMRAMIRTAQPPEEKCQCRFRRLISGTHHRSFPILPHCSLHTTGVPAANSNSVTSGGSVSSRTAATMSGASVVG